MTAGEHTTEADPDDGPVVSGTDVEDRVRAVLADRPNLREVAMFGGLAFMVDDRMVVSVQRRGGDLLVRVDPDHDEELLTHHGVRRAHMGTGRSMGTGWISVAGDALDAPAELAFWMDVALDHHRNQSASDS